jgi:hypothetical protein
MIANRRVLWCVLILVLLGSVSLAGCAGTPQIEKPQFTWRHYTYSVLLVPEMLGKSPRLELAFSLLRMEYPETHAQALHDILYGQPSLDEYRDSVINEQRKNYRSRAGDFPPADGGGTASYNWRYVERFSVKQTFERGIVIERDLETYSGGAHFGKTTRYYNIEVNADEFDPHKFRLLTLDDLFANYQEDQKLRDIIYKELRDYSNLGTAQPLSQGIYFTNEPELSFNFFISENGLGLRWDPAQIAPHAQGSIQIILPWHIISPLMLYSGIEALANYDIHLLL